MKDLHSHLLPGVDDGAKTIESTKMMLESAKENGVTHIMLTPHYVHDSKFSSPAKINNNIFDDVKKLANEEYGVEVFLGNEIYLTEDTLKHLKSGKINTLAGSKYILCEIPMHQKFNNLKSVFFELINAGYRPILAHPERYTAYIGDFDFFKQLYSMGVLLQINYPSLLRMYGAKPQWMAKKLLQMGIVSFVGSDIHSASELKYEKIKRVIFKLNWLVGKEKTLEITESNFEKVLNDEQVF